MADGTQAIGDGGGGAPAHPTAGIFLLVFKGAAMAYYIICGWLPTNFVVNFCICTFLIMCDFWTVKNVSGRLLVGLRWWNEVSESGGNEWKFESLQQGQRSINKNDSRLFWTVLYATPAIWALLGLVAALKFSIEYLLLVIIAFLLSGANLVGYFKCSKAAQNELRGLRRHIIMQGLRSLNPFGGNNS